LAYVSTPTGNTTRVQMMKINFNAKLLFFFLVSTLTLSFSVQAAGIVGGISAMFYIFITLVFWFIASVILSIVVYRKTQKLWAWISSTLTITVLMLVIISIGEIYKEFKSELRNHEFSEIFFYGYFFSFLYLLFLIIGVVVCFIFSKKIKSEHFRSIIWGRIYPLMLILFLTVLFVPAYLSDYIDTWLE